MATSVPTAARWRRALAWLAVGALLSACGQSRAEEHAQLRVVATISVLADFAAQVGGERVAVTSVVPLGVDPHTYEPTPSDARLVAEADALLRNGLGLERWLDRLVDGASGAVVTVTQGLPAVVDEAAGELDPHLWMDPVLAVGYVEAIRDALIALDPEGAEVYGANAEAYVGALGELDAWIAEQVAGVCEERRKLVTTHDAFRYFGDRYGLEVVGTIWGISTEREPSADELARLVDAVRAEGVRVVFVETTVSPRLMERVARDAGVAIGEPLYGDSLGVPGSGADSYVGMMETNTDRIVGALSE